MISFYKNEFRYGLYRIIALLVIAGFVWYFHQAVPDNGFEKKNLKPEEFHLTRQVIWVNVDSLDILIDRIEKKEPSVFSITIEDSKWIAVAENPKAFERIFLDGEPLSNWKGMVRNDIEKLKDRYGFSAKIKSEGRSRFVQLPAEIIQSIQLQLAD